MTGAAATAPNQMMLILGGARSGKSDFAVEVAEAAESPVTLLATAIAGDADMAARIRRHQEDRPASWGLVEEPRGVAGALAAIATEHLVIVDCLTIWAATRHFDGVPEREIVAEAVDIADVARTRAAPVLMVSNEVGLGVHPETELGRHYRDLLGRVNRAVAELAGTSLLLVAGRAIPLADPWDHVPAAWGRPQR
ncbi:MAG: bifunctional adenosylcobinamide kinase/adenosylcobinamide-phosphate guanylyltransferase [Actinomycetota bacterium]